MYERLRKIGYSTHHGQDGWWLGPEHELWLLEQQQCYYGAAAKLGEIGRQALAILLDGTGRNWPWPTN